MPHNDGMLLRGSLSVTQRIFATSKLTLDCWFELHGWERAHVRQWREPADFRAVAIPSVAGDQLTVSGRPPPGRH
jgi:hypothetical protein